MSQQLEWARGAESLKEPLDSKLKKATLGFHPCEYQSKKTNNQHRRWPTDCEKNVLSEAAKFE